MFDNVGMIWSKSGAEIGIMLLVAFILGYLVKVFSGSGKSEIAQLESEVIKLKAQTANFKKELKRAQKTQHTNFKLAPEAAEAPSLETTKNNLELIEGINSEIELILNARGIYSYAQLASTEVKVLQQILAHSGLTVPDNIITKWPDQSQLAAFGELDYLKKLQQELKKTT